MTEQANSGRSGTARPASPEIPWMKRWEKKPGRESAAEDRTTRLVRVDYMTMLEELEFR